MEAKRIVNLKYFHKFRERDKGVKMNLLKPNIKKRVDLIYTFERRPQMSEIIEVPADSIQTEKDFRAFLNIPPDTVKISMCVLFDDNEDSLLPKWILECDGKLFV